MMRFVHGAHIHRDGVAVVEIFDGDGLVAVLYPAEHGVKIVSQHFDENVVTTDTKFPPAITVRFKGSSPVGRGRYHA